MLTLLDCLHQTQVLAGHCLDAPEPVSLVLVILKALAGVVQGHPLVGKPLLLLYKRLSLFDKALLDLLYLDVLVVQTLDGFDLGFNLLEELVFLFEVDEQILRKILLQVLLTVVLFNQPLEIQLVVLLALLLLPRLLHRFVPECPLFLLLQKIL